MPHHRFRLSTILALVGAMTLQIATAKADEVIKTFSQSTKGSMVTIDHAPWDKLLKTYVKAGSDGLNRVAYARFKAEAHDTLKSYIAKLEAVDVARLDRAEQFAFWANLYNAKTIDIVLDKYPVASIKDINLGGGLIASIKGGPWDAKVVKISGRELSLNDIEHVILRGIFKDPRVHFAVNCASIGCPNLQMEAFVGARLEAQLDAAARAFVNSPRGVKTGPDGRVTVSSIYNWFQTDFGGSEQGVRTHLNQYATPELEAALSKTNQSLDFAYDWRLNDLK